ncbi:MAG: hypothetical protein ABL929_05315 [Ferruginibacter sp.]|nr:hypothetical protein [Ferruginibacter sp.]
MKNKILIALFVLCTTIANAQLTTNLIVNPRPPATLSKWAITQGTITFVANNIAGGARSVKIKTTLKSADGTEVSITNLNLAPTLVLQNGQTILNAATVYPLEMQQFTSKFQNALNRTGKLSADNYQLCVELVEPATFQPLTTPKCGTFYLAAVQLPIGIMPANEQVLDIAKAQTAIMFRWTPLAPRPQEKVQYRLQVFEILENQQPMQALRSNQPLLDKNIIAATQFIWQPQGILGNVNDLSDDTISIAQSVKCGGCKGWNGKLFIWSIQALDALGTPIGTDINSEGRSEPIIFSVKRKINLKH